MLHMAALNIVTTVDFFKNKINVQHGSEKQWKSKYFSF
jgi:hypothetical protein